MPAYLRTALIYQTPDIDDYKIFANRTIDARLPQPWENDLLYNRTSISQEYMDSFMKFDPVAFLIIRNGKMLMEEYYDGYGPESLSGSFSMAKSIVALLVGAAIDDGYIQHIHQPVSDFLPEFEIANHEVSIYQLLTMTSGLDWDERYANAFSITTKAYYGKNLKRLLQPLGILSPPGEVFEYTSGSTQLLAFLLEAATGKSLATYTSEKIWQKIGAENQALWSLDRENGIEKAYCCFNSNARDFARLGQLVLNHGAWEGENIISEGFIREAITPIHNVKDSKDNWVDYYGYQIWIVNHKGLQIPYFRGILGQYIFVIPQYDAVVVRLGHKRSDFRINNIPSDVYLYVDMALHILDNNTLESTPSVNLVH